jgi:hypothetical protein
MNLSLTCASLQDSSSAIIQSLSSFFTGNMSNLIDGLMLSNREKPTHRSSSIDKDKLARNEYNEEGISVAEVVDLVDISGVFDDARPIDLDASGKERPIGTLPLDQLNFAD